MKANPEIEEGTKTHLQIKAFRIKGSKVYAKVSDATIGLKDIVVVDIDNPKITDHMGLKFVELVTEEAEIIFLPIEKFNEIKEWAKQQKEAESNAGNTQDKPGSTVLPCQEPGKSDEE